MASSSTPAITVFQCINASPDAASLSLLTEGNPDTRVVKLPCAAMVQDVYLLKAFEADSDAVVVLICSEGECLYVSGNSRAEKRIERVRKMLDGIGLGGQRLILLSLPSQDEAACNQAIQETLSNLAEVGPSPAVRARSASAAT